MSRWIPWFTAARTRLGLMHDDTLRAAERNYLMTCWLPSAMFVAWRGARVPEVMGCFGLAAITLTVVYGVSGGCLLVGRRRFSGRWNRAMVIGAGLNIMLTLASAVRLVMVM